MRSSFVFLFCLVATEVLAKLTDDSSNEEIIKELFLQAERPTLEGDETFDYLELLRDRNTYDWEQSITQVNRKELVDKLLWLEKHNSCFDLETYQQFNELSSSTQTYINLNEMIRFCKLEHMLRCKTHLDDILRSPNWMWKTISKLEDNLKASTKGLYNAAANPTYSRTALIESIHKFLLDESAVFNAKAGDKKQVISKGEFDDQYNKLLKSICQTIGERVATLIKFFLDPTAGCDELLTESIQNFQREPVIGICNDIINDDSHLSKEVWEKIKKPKSFLKKFCF